MTEVLVLALMKQKVLMISDLLTQATVLVLVMVVALGGRVQTSRTYMFSTYGHDFYDPLLIKTWEYCLSGII